MCLVGGIALRLLVSIPDFFAQVGQCICWLPSTLSPATPCAITALGPGHPGCRSDGPLVTAVTSASLLMADVPPRPLWFGGSPVLAAVGDAPATRASAALALTHGRSQNLPA